MRTADASDNPGTLDLGAKIVSTLRDYPGMKKIIAEYVADLPAEIGKMQDLLTRDETQSLRRVVHQLHGTGGGYGFDAISELARDVEDAINAADNHASIALKVNSLANAIRRIEGFDDRTAISKDQGGLS